MSGQRKAGVRRRYMSPLGYLEQRNRKRPSEGLQSVLFERLPGSPSAAEILTQAGVPDMARGQSSSSSSQSTSAGGTPPQELRMVPVGTFGVNQRRPVSLRTPRTIDLSLLRWVYELTSAVIPVRELPGSSDGAIAGIGGGGPLPVAYPLQGGDVVAIGRGGGNDGNEDGGGGGAGRGDGAGDGDRGRGGGGRRPRAGNIAEARLAQLMAAAIQCIMDTLRVYRDRFPDIPAGERSAEDSAEMLRIVSEAVIACLAELKRELQPKNEQVRMRVNSGMATREARMITAIFQSWLVDGIDAGMATADRHMTDLHQGLFGELGGLNELLLAEHNIEVAVIQEAEGRAHQAQQLVVARNRDLQQQDENTQALVQRLGELQQDLHDTTGQLHDTGTSYMQVQDQIDTLQGFITQLQNETVSRNTYEELQGIHRHLLGQIEALASSVAGQPGSSSSGGSDQMARLREAIRALREAQATLSSDLQQSQQALQQAKEQMDDMDTTAAQEWSSWEATYKKDLRMLTDQLEQKMIELSAAEDRVRRHENTELNAATHIDALEQSIAALQAQIAQADTEGITRAGQLQAQLDQALRQNQILQAIEQRREQEAGQRRGRLTETGSLPGALTDLPPQASPSPNAMIGGDGIPVPIPVPVPFPLPVPVMVGGDQTVVDGANAAGPAQVTDEDMTDMFTQLPAAQGGGGDGGGKVAAAVVLGIVAALAFGFFLYRRKRKRS